MKTKLGKLVVLVFALCAPALVSAQQAQGTEQYWPGPWHMWSAGWGFWWIFPLLMFFFMIAVCVGFFLLTQRADSHAAHR